MRTFLSIFIVLILGGVCMAEDIQKDDTLFKISNHEKIEDEFVATEIFRAEPSRLVLYNEEGKVATIDFGGDEIVYSGDLPIDESARLFFDAVFGIYKEETEQKGIPDEK